MAEDAAAYEVEEDYSENLALVIAEAALDKKGLGLKVLDMRGLVAYTDYLIICSGTSDRHCLAIADSIERSLRPDKIRPLGVEGKPKGRWVLLDYGDVVVHIFVDSERDVYGLDSLWVDAPKMAVEVPPELERPEYPY